MKLRKLCVAAAAFAAVVSMAACNPNTSADTPASEADTVPGMGWIAIQGGCPAGPTLTLQESGDFTLKYEVDGTAYTITLKPTPVENIPGGIRTYTADGVFKKAFGWRDVYRPHGTAQVAFPVIANTRIDLDQNCRDDTVTVQLQRREFNQFTIILAPADVVAAEQGFHRF